MSQRATASAADGAGRWLAGIAGLLLLGCGGPPGETPDPAQPPTPVDSLSLTTPEEIQAEVEVLGYEIADLEAFVQAAPEPHEEQRALLASARSAREAVGPLVAAGDTAAAIDSLEAVHGRVEDVKRSLGLAEEWGEEFEDDSLAADTAL